MALYYRHYAVECGYLNEEDKWRRGSYAIFELDPKTDLMESVKPQSTGDRWDSYCMNQTYNDDQSYASEIDCTLSYWNGSTWEIDPSEYNVDAAPVTLYTPKLQKDEAIIEWATAKIRNKQKIDETFIKFLTWLLPKPSRDAQMLDRQIQKIYKEYKEWDIDMFQFMNDVVNNITINPSEQLRTRCPHCSQEATSTVQFPNGVKVLFEVKSNIKKFGSR